MRPKRVSFWVTNGVHMMASGLPAQCCVLPFLQRKGSWPRKVSQAYWGLETRNLAKEWEKTRQTDSWTKPLLASFVQPPPKLPRGIHPENPLGLWVQVFHSPDPPPFSRFPFRGFFSCLPGTWGNVDHIWEAHYLWLWVNLCIQNSTLTLDVSREALGTWKFLFLPSEPAI